MKIRAATIDDYRWLYEHTRYGQRNTSKRHSDCIDLIKAKFHHHPATFLEVGCGHGAFVREMSEAGSLVAIGLDPAIAPDPGEGYRFVQGSIDDIPSLGSFHYVCSFDVLEHLPEHEIPTSIDMMTTSSIHGQWHAIYNGPDVWGVRNEHVDLHLTKRPCDWWVEQFQRRNNRVIVHPAKHIPHHRFVLEVIK